MRKWRTEDSSELYNLNGWGRDYFSVNKHGNAVVSPLGENGPRIDLKEVMDELLLRDVDPPVLIRFPEIIGHRIKKISDCFKDAAKENGYLGKYYSVYPIKVNQQRPVVEELVRHGKQFNVGLEAGSKPELHAVLAIMDNPEALIVCNGYKDYEFIELALLAQKMGKRVYVVVEKLNELRIIKTISEKIDLRPNIGIRIKLSASGAGKWEDSGGDKSKFGLNAPELIEAVTLAKEMGILDCIKLIHFHLGSQITNIRKIKTGFREMAQYYAELVKQGCNVEFVDIGGGLGVDYDGNATAYESSVNYSIREYASDAIFSLVDICNTHDIPHPNLISESGRALTAHHSILAFNVLEKTSIPCWDTNTHQVNDSDHKLVRDLWDICANLSSMNLLESWHDALQLKEDVLDLFNHGIVDLDTRAKAERLYWAIARDATGLARKLKHPPSEITSRANNLADKYFCNFSIFQSLPDSWAIEQLFPIMPIHRLNEQPTVSATLQDITCDSDGRIDRFVGIKDYCETIRLHELVTDQPYYLGVFLVGAYQEILGDLHNLFGDTNAVHVHTDGDSWKIDKVIDGESVADVLDYVQYNAKKLVRNMETWVSASVKANRISLEQGKYFLDDYRSGLYGYTYLE